jgi:hypothetical protein
LPIEIDPGLIRVLAENMFEYYLPGIPDFDQRRMESETNGTAACGY